MDLLNETSDRLASFVIEDAGKVLAAADLSGARLGEAMDKHPEGQKWAHNLVLQIARVQTICAHERPVDLELFTASIQEAIDALPELGALITYFMENPGLSILNPEMDEDDAQAARMRFQDYMGSFLL